MSRFGWTKGPYVAIRVDRRIASPWNGDRGAESILVSNPCNSFWKTLDLLMLRRGTWCGCLLTWNFDTTLALTTTSRRTQRISDWLVFDGLREASRSVQASRLCWCFRLRSHSTVEVPIVWPRYSAQSPLYPASFGLTSNITIWSSS